MARRATDLVKELANELCLKTAKIEIVTRDMDTVHFLAYSIPYKARTTPDGEHLVRGTCCRASEADAV